MLYSPELAQRGHDDDMSSTSEDDGYPEDIDQDKNDDSTEDSDTHRSDAESDGVEFGHRNDSEHNDAEEKSGPSISFADMPGKSRKKKNTKELTSLQTMILRMVGQEIPEEGQEVEEFSEEDDDNDSDDSEVENQLQKHHKEDAHSHGSSAASSRQQAPPQSVLLLRHKHFPCQHRHLLDHHLPHPYGLLDHHLPHPYGLLDHLRAFLLPLPGAPPFLDCLKCQKSKGLYHNFYLQDYHQGDLLALPEAHLQVCPMGPLLKDPHQGYLLLHIQVSLLLVLV